MEDFYTFNTKDVGNIEVSSNVETKQVMGELEWWTNRDDDREFTVDIFMDDID